jgi:GH35 family endo-1,4-beta-xylanase
MASRDWPHIEPTSVIADYIEKVLRWCRDENPDATYLVNDYGLEDDKGKDGGLTGNDGSTVTAASQRKRYVELIDELSQRGVAPDAVGLQQHTAGWISHEHQVGVYDEIARTGLPLHITEFWAKTSELIKAGIPEDEAKQMQADYICNYVTCAYGHPSVEAFFFWGVFGNAVEWRGNELTSSHELTPLYHRLDDLLNHQWKTRTTVKTNADGELNFRGFFGDYALSYQPNGGATNGVPFTVSADHANQFTLRALV